MLARVLSAIENVFFPQFPRQFPALAVAAVEDRFDLRSGAWESLKNTLQDAILWAVPKSRRSIERRLKRKYGSPDYRPKLLQPKNHLRICITCGHHHEVGLLCPHCYGRVKTETQNMQNEIKKELGLKPVDQDVIVLYEGERMQGAPETWQDKRIVELKRPRPAWFSKNLMQKTTQPPATTKEVKPTDLG